MSYLLPHLKNGWAVDQAILSEDDRVVVIRFGSDADDTCMRMDEVSARNRASEEAMTNRRTRADLGGGGG